MGFKQLSLERSYISCGNDNISHAFLIPALKCTKLYRRSVGFFSSGVFQTIVDGVVTLARNGGNVQLIASPKLSEDDIAAIKAGYAKRDKAILDHADEDFFESIAQLGDNDLILLSELIANKVLDIKIAVTENFGAYHDKFGILEDFDGNTIAFYGSANSTLNGYQNNYEKIRLARGWIPGECESVRDELQEFDSLWNDKNEFVKVYDYYESAKKNIFQIVEQRKGGTTYTAPPITLRDYQQEAIQAANPYIPNYERVVAYSETYAANDSITANGTALGNFKLTFYCACEQCSGGYGDNTATGTKCTEGRTIAVDPKVIPLGSEVFIEGFGSFIAEDTGGAIKQNKIDIYLSDHDRCYSLGVANANVYLMNK